MLCVGGGEPSRSHKTVEHVFTEEDWSDPALCPPYERSKTLAEKLAWEIWSSLPGQLVRRQSRASKIMQHAHASVHPRTRTQTNLQDIDTRPLAIS